MPDKYELFAIVLAIPLAVVVTLSARQAPADAALLAKAKAIHEKAITIDTHVGIGTDFDGGGGIPGFNDHSEAFNVTVELVRRGYTEQQIVKIWGGNLLRVWREVEKAATRK